jgi:hypothetical protein
MKEKKKISKNVHVFSPTWKIDHKDKHIHKKQASSYTNSDVERL